jgi:hypothetical protein
MHRHWTAEDQGQSAAKSASASAAVPTAGAIPPQIATADPTTTCSDSPADHLSSLGLCRPVRSGGLWGGPPLRFRLASSPARSIQYWLAGLRARRYFSTSLCSIASLPGIHIFHWTWGIDTFTGTSRDRKYRLSVQPATVATAPSPHDPATARVEPGVHLRRRHSTRSS